MASKRPRAGDHAETERVAEADRALFSPPGASRSRSPEDFTEARSEAKATGSPIEQARVEVEYGSVCLHDGRAHEAIGAFARAEQLLSEAPSEQTPPRLNALLHINYGLALGFAFHFEQARRAHTKALAIAEQADLEDLKFRCWVNTGYSHFQLGDTASATYAYYRALANHRPDYPYYGLGMVSLADLFIEMGNISGAEHQIEQAIINLSPKWMHLGEHRIKLAMARIRGRTGDRERSDELLESAKAGVAQTDVVGAARTWLAAADLALFHRDIDELEQAWLHTDRLMPATWFPTTARVMLVEGLVETGNFDAAAAHASNLEIDAQPFLIRQRLLEALRKLSVARQDWAAAYDYLERRSRPAVPLRSETDRFSARTNVNYELSRNLTNIVDLSAQYQALRRNVEMAQIAAHDLRTPFMSSALLIDLLRDQVGPDLRQSFDVLADELQRANVIVDEITHLTTKTIEDESEDRPPPCVQTVVATIGRVTPILKAKGQTVAFIDASDGPQVSLNPHLLEQVVENVLSNASKYSNPDTTILVKLSNESSSRVDISVTDDGLGFSADDIEQAFGYQRTLSAKPTAGESASGLGLYIVRQIVRGAGGSVSITSAGRGRGATVHISLPSTRTNLTRPTVE